MYVDHLAELGKLRAQQEEAERDRGQANYQTPDMGAGMAGRCVTSEPSRPGVRERVGAQLNQTHRALRKAQLLEELALLLAKHPDVARILDLLEETR